MTSSEGIVKRFQMAPWSVKDLVPLLQREAFRAIVLGTSVAWYAMRPPDSVSVWLSGLAVSVAFLVGMGVLNARSRATLSLTLHPDALSFERGGQATSVRFSEVTNVTTTPEGLELQALGSWFQISNRLDGYQELIDSLVARLGQPTRRRTSWVPWFVFLWWLGCVVIGRTSIPLLAVPLLIFSVPYGLLLGFARGGAWANRLPALAWMAIYDWVPLCRLLNSWGFNGLS